jgi:membrane-associated phospholipid phosphatase
MAAGRRNCATRSAEIILPTNQPLSAPSPSLEPIKPTEPAPKKSRRFLFLMLLLIGAAALAAAFYWDAPALAYFAKDKSAAAGTAASAISTYGDWPPIAGALALSFGIAVAVRSRRVGRVLLVVLLACSLAGASASALRLLTGRARPSAKIPPGWHGPHLGSFKYCSFPSAHTAVIAGGAAALTLLVPFGALPGVALVGVMAWARMRTGAHHLSDVVAGALLGAALGAWVATKVPASWPPQKWFAKRPT